MDYQKKNKDLSVCTTFVWRDFVFIFSSASEFKEILYQIQGDKRLAEHQPADPLGQKCHFITTYHSVINTNTSKSHLQPNPEQFPKECRYTYTLSSTSSAMRRISKRIIIFPECSRISASFSVTNSLCQSAVGLPGAEPEGRAVCDVTD